MFLFKAMDREAHLLSQPSVVLLGGRCEMRQVAVIISFEISIFLCGIGVSCQHEDGRYRMQRFKSTWAAL
jgi:hypothetical protein